MTMPLGVTPAGGGIERATQRQPWKTAAAVAIPLAILAGVGYTPSTGDAEAAATTAPAPVQASAPPRVTPPPVSASPRAV